MADSRLGQQRRNLESSLTKSEGLNDQSRTFLAKIRERAAGNDDSKVENVVRKINERIDDYKEHLKGLTSPDENSKNKLEIVETLYIRSDKPNELDVNLRTFKTKFAKDKETVRKHRLQSIFTYFWDSEGEKMVKDVEGVLSRYYVEETVIDDLKKLLSDYKTHIDEKLKQSHIDNADILKTKKHNVEVLISILTPPQSTVNQNVLNANILKSFNVQWKEYFEVIQQRRSIGLFQSEGKKLVNNVDDVLIRVNRP